jgi:hypothetical protein
MQTQTATVTDKMTSVQTATMTQTMTDSITMTDTVTKLTPTTVTSVWVQTQTMDNVSSVPDPYESRLTSYFVLDQDSREHCYVDDGREQNICSNNDLPIDGNRHTNTESP